MTRPAHDPLGAHQKARSRERAAGSAHAGAVAAREAFLAGTPLDDALKPHVTSKGAEAEPSRAEIPPAEECTRASDPECPTHRGALIEAYRQRKISSGELKSSTWDKIWQPGMREVLAVMHRHPSPGHSRRRLWI